MLEIEIWKPIYVNGYETNYMVSTLGRIVNTKTNLILKPFKNIKHQKNKDDDWYLSVRLYFPNKIYKKGYDAKVHRLVATAFVPNPDNKPFVNHIDGNKTNNNVNNLEWVTNAENVQHSFDNGLQISIKGEDHYKHILTESDVHYICQKLCEGYSETQLAREFGVSKNNIHCIKLKKTWKEITSKYNMPKPKEVSHRWDDLYEKIDAMIYAGLTNKEIRKKLSLEPSQAFTTMIWKRRKLLLNNKDFI